MAKDVLSQTGFHPVVKQWFHSQFDAPSPPQAKGWPSISKGKHTLILAPTGSGKTLAAFLWSIDQLFRKSLMADEKGFKKNRAGIHTLYISPLKALNNDIQRNLKAPLKQINQIAREKGIDAPEIRVAVRTGDTPPKVRQSMLRKPPHILITTPESLYLLLTSERGRELFPAVQSVIVDEIHAICTNKRGVHLSLSLERLMPLCETEPVRIGLSATQKPLKRIAAYLGGRQASPPNRRSQPRPVQIVDCGQRKNLDLKVITPVDTFDELPDASVWEPLYQRLYEWIRAHRTTLVFAGMRAQTEKIARRLNEIHRRVSGDDEAELALAHHGSISRDMRYDIEARMKAGKVPAVIATASLELGIDIGSIDLVVHLEAPKSIAAAMQRVGRSGHLLSATSKGRIVVMYPSDLDDAAAIARCMLKADIEPAGIPENALDVLAQQVVAEVAAKTWNYDDLLRLVRQSYCYRNLPATQFKHVVEMLSGRFAENPLTALNPRISWDRVNNRLIARRGSRLVAVLNSGTIPDRGYYGVYLKDSNVRLGEVEEEFVFESRVGEAFFLGNSEWRIDAIMQSKVVVTAVAAIKPKAPFWKGDLLFRDYSTSLKIGRFRQELIDRIEAGTAEQWLMDNHAADRNTATNLIQYYQRQREHFPDLPTANQFVVETTATADALPVVIIHAPNGARVNGAWAVALAAALEGQWQTMIQYSFDDDGIMLRMPDMTEPPPIDRLFALTAREIEAHLVAALPASPIFAVQFRYNAARALLLPRSQIKKRIPLWLQRLRAADLLQAISQYEEFPAITETFRDCLQDVFDLPALKKIIDSIHAGGIYIRYADSAYPSPMAASIMFKFVASHLYETDKTRQPEKVTPASHQVLTNLLDHENIPAVVTADLVEQAERRWQFLAPGFKANSAEEVFDIIEALGPIDGPQLQSRCQGDPQQWLPELIEGKRIQLISRSMVDERRQYWVSAELVPDAKGSFDASKNLVRVQLYLSAHGPVEIKQLQQDLDLTAENLRSLLKQLEQQKKVVHGQLVEGVKERLWCDRQNFMQLYRMAVAGRRSGQDPANRSTFNRFLFEWHHIGKPGRSLLDCVRQYRGLKFSACFFERSILTSRFRKSGETPWMDKLAELKALISNGEIIALAGKPRDAGRRSMQFWLRGDGSLFTDRKNLLSAAQDLHSKTEDVFAFLGENGASYVRDIEMGTGLSRLQLQSSLRELADKGLASCDDYESFLGVLQSASPNELVAAQMVKKKKRSGPQRGLARGRSNAARKLLQERFRIKDGRWFLTSSFAVMGKPLDPAARAAAQARLLLQRYGIVVKEFYRRETGLLPWYDIFQSLKRMEWQGEIRRGYFVEGLSGVQFALPEALDLLIEVNNDELDSGDQAVLLSSLDPALPYGGMVDWQLTGPGGQPLKITRLAGNHIAYIGQRPVVYVENYGQRFSRIDKMAVKEFNTIAALLRDWLKLPTPVRPRNKIEISQIDGKPVISSKYDKTLTKLGYEKDGGRFVLWPSAL